MLTQDLLNEIFTYDPETGVLERKVPSKFDNGIRSVSGKNCYVHVRVSDKVHQSHRVIWLMVYGHIPKGMAIDHINGDKGDNRLSNLRLSTWPENTRNQCLAKDSSTGFKGVNAVGSSFRARLNTPSGRKNLGCFPTAAAAARAYDKAALANFGEFARTNAMMGLLPNTSDNA